MSTTPVVISARHLSQENHPFRERSVAGGRPVEPDAGAYLTAAGVLAAPCDFLESRVKFIIHERRYQSSFRVVDREPRLHSFG